MEQKCLALAYVHSSYAERLGQRTALHPSVFVDSGVEWVRQAKEGGHSPGQRRASTGACSLASERQAYDRFFTTAWAETHDLGRVLAGVLAG